MKYERYFVVVWGSVTLAALGVVGFGTASIVLGVANHVELAIGLGSTAALCIVYTLLMRLHGSQVLVRAGRWPTLCQTSRFPKTPKQAVAACEALQREHGYPPAVVGGAWAFYLYRKMVKPNCIFTHRMRGLLDKTNDEWAAGSTIREVLDYYSQQKSDYNPDGLTLSTHPTMEYITIGAWFATASHGNGGDGALGSSKTMRVAYVYDMTSNTGEYVDYLRLRLIFDDVAKRTQWIVLKVQFQNLIDNVRVQKKGIIVKDPASAADWLEDNSRLRLCFMGAAREYALGLRWQDCCYDQKEADLHLDPHFCSRVCTFLQVDVFSAIVGWHEPMSLYQGSSTYLNANRWMPSLLPIMSTVVALTGYLNTEIYFQLPKALDGSTLWRMIQALITIHKQHGGRSEIRYGKKRSKTPVFLDISMQKGFRDIFQMLKREFGVTKAALHIGKHQCDISPLEPVPVGVIYNLYKPHEASVSAALFKGLVI